MAVTRNKVSFVAEGGAELHEAVDSKLLPVELGGSDAYIDWWPSYLSGRMHTETGEWEKPLRPNQGSNLRNSFFSVGPMQKPRRLRILRKIVPFVSEARC